MLRRHWQNLMIALARSPGWTTFMQSNRSTTGLSQRYVGGCSPETALTTALDLQQQNIRSSAFYLGEYVDSEQRVRENLQAKLAIAQLLVMEDQDLHISVDPTQLGCSLDWAEGVTNIRRLAQELRDLIELPPTQRQSSMTQPATDYRVHCLMLDMEDFQVNQPTIDLHDQLQDEEFPVALTLQAYLRKTEEDMLRQIKRGSRIRLVKGAFAAGEKLAFQSQSEIKSNYQRLIDCMLRVEAKNTGFYPIFATHDHRLHRYAIKRAEANGWSPNQYEFEMLYGARMDVAKRLAQQGQRIRLYLPFGKDWWPYAVRRIGENPANALLLARSLINR